MENLKGKVVWVTGHTGLVGSAVMRRLETEGCHVLRPVPRYDLRNPHNARKILNTFRPDIVIHCAARVDGIQENIDTPADMVRDNLLIDANVIHACRNQAERFVYLSSACAYPTESAHVFPPFKESDFMEGQPESTNRAYAVAKIAGMELLRGYQQQFGMQGFSVVPCNVYGPADRSNHVIPMLMRKMHHAKVNDLQTVEIWGSGSPIREFIYSDDLADGILNLLKHYDGQEPVNIPGRSVVNIRQLVDLIADVIGLENVRFLFDRDKPDGASRKELDGRIMTAMGWKAATPLAEGLAITYKSMYP